MITFSLILKVRNVELFIQLGLIQFFLSIISGSLSRNERIRRALRHQNLEERRDHPGWWCGMHDDWKACPGSTQQTTIPCPITFVLSNHGKDFFFSLSLSLYLSPFFGFHWLWPLEQAHKYSCESIWFVKMSIFLF